MRKILLTCAISGLLFAVACGGSGSSSNGTPSGGTNGGASTAGGNTIATQGAGNVAPLVVDSGPTVNCGSGSFPNSTPCNDANQPFTTIVVCPPNSTTNCVTIDHVFLDTGSSGLRIPYSYLNQRSAALVSALTPVTVSGSSGTLAECYQYAGLTFNWGSVRQADVYMGGSNNQGELAQAIPIHLLADPALPSGTNIPTDCSGSSSSGQSVTDSEMDTVATLGANAMLGVSPFLYDCDFAGLSGSNNPCTSFKTMPTGSVIYYTCTGTTSSSCGNSTLSVPIAKQVINPVGKFAADNNGTIVELPQVAVGGSGTVSGSLVFGIGTQANNTLANGATMLALDTNINNPDWSGFYTQFYGTTYPNAADDTAIGNATGGLYVSVGSIIDSGSSLTFFLDRPTLARSSATSSIVDCPSVTFEGLYCTTSGSGTYLYQALTATNVDAGGNSRGVNFNVSNAMSLPQTNVAYSDVAGPNTVGPPLEPSLTSTDEAFDGYFDWGLPFFFGRNVYTAIQGVTPPSGVSAGPWWAY